MSLFSLQGYVHIGARLVTGKPGVLPWVGNAPECKLALKTATTDKNESYSGSRLQIGRLQRDKTATITLSLDEFSLANLAMGLYGDVTNIVSGTVTAEPLPPGLVAGDSVKLDNPFVTSVVIHDSAVAPVLVDASKYRVERAGRGGLITMLDVTGFTQPFTADYSYASKNNLAMFSAAPKQRYFMLDGVNTEDDTPVIVELYKVQFDPISEAPLINPDYGTLQMVGSALADPLAAVDPLLGQFGRMIQKAA